MRPRVNPQTLLDYMRLHRLAVQASVSVAGVPQAAMVGFAVSDQFEIVFDTIQTTRKAQNLRQNPHLALVIGGWVPDDERTVQYEGEADEPSGAELDRLKQVYYAAYPDGPGRASWPGLIYVRVRPRWVRYSDYNKDPPEIVEFQAKDLAR
jgi:general stress protein 26